MRKGKAEGDKGIHTAGDYAGTLPDLGMSIREMIDKATGEVAISFLILGSERLPRRPVPAYVGIGTPRNDN